ncbi:MAG: hypothetical protein KBT06_05720 [Prevotellaceae bacterium]|nr:hypothetical protein [Candidatus Colivivens equi]
MDKFTDPLIDCSGLKQGYVIFEPGRGGEHKKPRYHERSIVNIDALSAFVALYGVIKSVFKTKKIELEFVELMKSINMAFDDINVNSSLLRKKIYADIFSVHLYERIYRKKGVEAVFATVRPLDVFCAGNNLGLKTYELQHGVSYEGTELYSGFRDERLLPSYFLAFGENEPKDVYGISEDRIINIGFAFHTFLNNLIPKTELNISNAVLVVSDPEITNTLVPLVAGLAKDNKDMTMYYRCHPHEFLTSEQKQVLLDSGVKIQDNTINISIVLNQFNNIIGENSTVLYEAISCGKKVGKLFFEGLNPEYLSPTDNEYFWEIKSQEDFENFIKAPVPQKKNKSIYSDFNVGLFKNLLKR